MDATAQPAEATRQPPPDRPVVLELIGVDYRPDASNALQLRGVQLTLRQGDLLLVRMDRARRTRDAMSMIQGLSPPHSGTVRLQQQDWAKQTLDEQFAMRGRTGRIFDGPAWVHNLNVYENITQARLHHGQDEIQLRRRYRELVEHFAMRDITRERPAFVGSDILQVHQWIRALIGDPPLLILERPMQSVAPEKLERLIEAVDQAIVRGAAVMWLTSNPGELEAIAEKATLDIEIDGGVWS